MPEGCRSYTDLIFGIYYSHAIGMGDHVKHNRFVRTVLAGYRIAKRINRWLERCRIRVYAAQASFFMIISALPMLLLILLLGGMLLPRGEASLRETLLGILPAEFLPLADTVLSEVEEKANPSLLSVSILTLLWSSSRGIKSIGAGIRNVCGGERDRDPVIHHMKYLLYTFLYVLAVILALLVWVFGDTLTARLPLGQGGEIPALLNSSIFLLLLIAFFFLTFRGMAGLRGTPAVYLPGAVFAALGWLFYSRFFEYYVEHFGNYSYIYGSLTAMIVVMIWLYSCMEILLVGAGVNAFLTRKGLGRRQKGKR